MGNVSVEARRVGSSAQTEACAVDNSVARVGGWRCWWVGRHGGVGSVEVLSLLLQFSHLSTSPEHQLKRRMREEMLRI